MTDGILFIWVIAGIMLNGIISWFHNEGETIWITPANVYRDTELNWFGSLFVYMIMFIINPLWYIAKLVGWILFWICNFIWWILHVGRKTNDTE